MMNADGHGANARRLMALGLMTILLAGFVSACSVTSPDDERWRDVSAFSWPADTSAFMHYKTINMAGEQVDTVNIEMADPTDRKRMLKTELTAMNRWDTPDVIYKLNKSNTAIDRYFIPLKDTLIIIKSEMGVTYALVAPLDKGSAWDCTYDTSHIATMRGTVKERYSYRKVEGKIYKNVLEVEYTPLSNAKDTTISWVCFYAQGIGPIQTIKNHQIDPTPGSGNQTPTKVDEETVLVETNVQQK